MLAKRLFDLVLSAIALVVLSPVMALAGLAVIIEDGRPVVYKARRAGRGGEPFDVYKFRTMRRGADQDGKVSSSGDRRVTRVGSILRTTKIDELPQLINVLNGDMSIVGPRPEDVDIVADHYTETQMETLSVRPGLASPGSLYNYTHGETQLVGSDPAQVYLNTVLPTKLSLELVYVRNRSIWYDVRIVARTITTILVRSAGGAIKRLPPEMAVARDMGLVSKENPRCESDC